MPRQEFDLDAESGTALLLSEIPPALVREVDQKLARLHSDFAGERTEAPECLVAQSRAWTRSHRQEADVEQVLHSAASARRDFSVLTTSGIGGSDLAARVFHDTLNHAYHNLMPAGKRGGAPEVYFVGDTFDPFRLAALLEMLASRNLLAKSLFNVISKSGQTGETITALLLVRENLSKQYQQPDAWRDQVLVTTGLNAESILYRWHLEHPFYTGAVLPVPEGVGGRFSAFSPVGLFFLAVTAGNNETPEQRVREALAGVEEAEARFWDELCETNLAYRLARWLHLAEVGARKTTLVFYNYADQRCLGDWFVQLYEESLQKRDLGLNVIAARGPTSNHSLLNGILEGPKDKIVLFIDWGDLGADLKVPEGSGIPGDLAAFEGLFMGQVQSASYRGTAAEFTGQGVPCATIHVPRRDTRHLCGLMRLLMDAVAVKGRLQDLHLNAAGQPDGNREATYRQDAVEGYKQRTREQAARTER